jgi:hypothetical protein
MGASPKNFPELSLCSAQHGTIFNLPPLLRCCSDWRAASNILLVKHLDQKVDFENFSAALQYVTRFQLHFQGGAIRIGGYLAAFNCTFQDNIASVRVP